MKKLMALSVVSLTILVLVAVPVMAQDADSDYWTDQYDNCTITPNANQRDSDADGFGRELDPGGPLDELTLGNVCDNCPFHYNPDQTDTDGDGIGDACDPAPPPMGAISGTDLEAYHACIITAFADPASFFNVTGGSAVFDTGSDVIVLGGLTAQAIEDGNGFFDPQSTQTMSLKALDSRNMGQQTGNDDNQAGTDDKGWPTLGPEAVVEDVWVRVTGLADEDRRDLPILVGAPFATQVYAYIDHTRTTSIPTGELPPNHMQICPAVSFWPDAAGTPPSYTKPDGSPSDDPLDPPPTPLFCADLERFGSTDEGDEDEPTKDKRYYIRGMRFENGSNIVESPTSGAISTPTRFLYDTGNNTTQISETMAGSGGLGINTSVCSGPDCVLHEIDDVLRRCYKIDSVKIDADDNSYQYVLNEPWVCVVPDRSGALGESSDANIGMNYFEPTQQLFNGIDDKLCLFAGVATSTEDTTPPSCEQTSENPGPPASIEITVQDGESGLADIIPLVEINAIVTVPHPSPGTNDPVVIIAESIAQHAESQVDLLVTDVAGNPTECRYTFNEQVGAAPCDVDGNGAVDISDIREIGAHRGTTHPDYDIDGDGQVTVLDMRQCVIECDKPRCAP